jgi:hypothetical protein
MAAGSSMLSSSTFSCIRQFAERTVEPGSLTGPRAGRAQRDGA